MEAGLANNHVFAGALKGLKIRRNWKAAVQLIHFMRDRGITPDTVTYTSAIAACERSSNTTAALALLETMRVRWYKRLAVMAALRDLVTYAQADGAKPNHWTYSAAISVCAHGRQLQDAMRLWEVRALPKVFV
jgi:pentatricopeptide repeat protein